MFHPPYAASANPRFSLRPCLGQGVLASSPPFPPVGLQLYPSLSNMATQQGNTSIATTYGAAYIGVIAAGILYGVSSVQTWYYFNKYGKDVWYIKSLVAAVWTFETIHQILITHTVYYYIVTNYDNPSSLGGIIWSVLLEVLFNGLIGLLVQGFLTLRVWRLSGKNVSLTTIVFALVLACFGCSVAFTAQSLKLKTWAELAQLKGLSMAVNLLGATTDVVIAAALCLFLHRSRTGFKKSDTMIRKLIAFTVSTGFFTSICAIASLISILASGDTLIYVAFYFSLGRLYSNSVLATLNARQTIRALGEHSDELSFSLQSGTKSGPRIPSSQRSTNLTNIAIKIDTLHDYIRDQRPAGEDEVVEPESAVTEKSF
ncbi:hypothetical protein CPC08DRAFT_182786 [Agrocybe pediades]|nr:hypothetical protein CPC08DRAFT_182786 [Agrocybe pediades]